MRKSQYKIFLPILALYLGLSATQAWAASADKKMIERGQYLVHIAGCNDCHTDGYLINDGKVPVSEWLKGSSFGWSGPWGTTYPRNLRLFVKDLSEAQWIKEAKSLKRRPPMPYFNLNAMKDDDLRKPEQRIITDLF